MAENTLNNPLKKEISPLVQEVFFEMIKILPGILMSDVPLIKKLEGRFPRFSSCGQPSL
jgi:hypothetical protein